MNMIMNRKKYSGLNLQHKQNNRDWLNGSLKRLKEERKNNMNKIKIKMEKKNNNKIKKKIFPRDPNLIAIRNRLMPATF